MIQIPSYHNYDRIEINALFFKKIFRIYSGIYEYF